MEPSLRNRFHSFGTSRNLVQGFGRLPQTTPKLYWKNPKPFRLLGKKKQSVMARNVTNTSPQTTQLQPLFHLSSAARRSVSTSSDLLIFVVSKEHIGQEATEAAAASTLARGGRLVEPFLVWPVRNESLLGASSLEKLGALL